MCQTLDSQVVVLTWEEEEGFGFGMYLGIAGH